MIISSLFLALFIQVARSNEVKEKNDNYTSLNDFKKKIYDFINVNGGLESLGRAAGDAYQDIYSNYAENSRYPYLQGGDSFQNYGYAQGQAFQYGQQSGSAQQNNGVGLYQYEGGYGQGIRGYDQVQNGLLNSGYGQGYYGHQGGYGQQNNAYGQGHYGQLYNRYGQLYGYDQNGYPGESGSVASYPVRRYPPSLYQRPQSFQPGFLDALQSITRHDDLRCVPRLLCEVASAGKSGTGSQSSSPYFMSFASKDSLISLLTVLNFVDDSPIMTFGRAAILGYTARGDNRACLQAYPTCPRDPDRLIEYLNNHNGGFFRFFGGAPNQNVPFYNEPQNNYHRLPSGNKIKFQLQNSQHQYSPAYNQYRIISKPGVSSSLFFNSGQHQGSDELTFHTFPSRRGKKLSFPVDNPTFTLGSPQYLYQQNNDYSYSQDPHINSATSQLYQRPTTQFFPDRTGTGDLLLDYNQLFSEFTSGQNYIKRDSKLIQFPESNSISNYYNRRMTFPLNKY